MAITYKIMKTLTRPDGDNKVRYEVFDSAGRKMIAPDWYEHENEAFAAGQHIVKDGILYRFLIPHTAGAEWNSAEVLTVTVAEDIAAIVTSLNQKANKVSGATNGNFAALDASGNLTDSGKKPSDFITEHQDISGKADKSDTVLNTTLSRGRKAETTVGTGSIAFGDTVEASGVMAKATGNKTKATGNYSSAEGMISKATATAAHAEGATTEANGNYSHAEGDQTVASGAESHAEGYLTTASGEASHAEGHKTVANHYAQHVFGTYNVADDSALPATSKGNYVEIVGCGGAEVNRRNARTLDWSGNERLRGNLYVGANNDGTGGTKVAITDTDAVQGNFAEFDANGNPVDSGHKHSDYVTDISGKADKVSNANANDLAALDGNGNLKDSGYSVDSYGGTPSSSKLWTSQKVALELGGKTDKVSGATNGNFAGLDGNGNLTDSGKKASDFVEGDDFYATEMPMSTSDSTKVSEAVSGLKSAFDNSFYKYKSSVYDYTSGTSTSKDKRLLLNVDNPIPDGIRLGNLEMLGGANALTGSIVVELTTYENGTYTVYDSVTKNIATEKEVPVNVLSIDKVTHGETYIFITLSVAYMFHVPGVSGKKMVLSDTTTGTSFTTRSVNNYEIAFQIYCCVSDEFIDKTNQYNSRIEIRKGETFRSNEGIDTLSLYSGFVHGNLNNGVLDETQLYRVSSKDIITFENETKLTIADGFAIGIHYFVSGVFDDDTGWLTGDYTVPEGSTFKVVITRSPTVTTEIADIQTFVNSVLFDSATEKRIKTLTNSVNNIPLDYVNKENMVSYISKNGFKLIEQSQLIDGYYCVYNTGSLAANNSYCVTPLIPVRKNMNIVVSGGANGSQVAYYKANGDYASAGEIVKTATSFTVPDNNNIAYMRWCTLIENKSSVSLLVYEQETEDTVYVDTTKGILAGVIEAYTKGLKKIIVYAGEYDVLEEYEDYFGSDCWENYVETGYNSVLMGVYGRGIWIDNLEIVFMPGSKVIAHYTGNNAAVKKMFSPFAVGSDATIIGLVVDSSELRYCVHPDFHPRSYETLLFKDCDFHHLKGADWNEAIGCGFGAHSYWTFENCVFHSDGNYRVFRIHNAGAANAQSKAIVKNCYVDGQGYMSFNNYGDSTLVSTIEVYGCSWINAARVGTEPGAENVNMSMLAWNNETRS